ncbi:MAG: UDP-N-acetylglucosamine--N-acetylmuramyl-(pentapeptide) pyrophosphoryl-undecaprenol N-acetylglucosamine transferase [Acidobacteria bacterium]|nr:UDP-N-acetylglucosamine--N-acetylmuramyl-(pentapeptide) pyrophosphoryl-undecaprenol N-acetylglucosamine transferase [Acidobacteriota bacterium]
MPFPQLDAGPRKLLYFSRGRGRGHAIPDLEIWLELAALGEPSDVQVRFASYGTGARTLEEAGHPVIDVDLPDEGSITAVTVLAGKLIRWLQPDLVVSHEEFPVFPAARIFDVPAAAVLGFFGPPEWLSMRSLRFADRVIFTDRAGLYPEPPDLAGRVDYVGPVLRRFAYARRDRAKARRELGIAAHAFVAAMLPGSWSEAEAPVAELVLAAWAALPAPKHLLWVAGANTEAMTASVSGRCDVTVVRFDPRIERIMVAADVAITKVNRLSLIELEHLGVPSVSLSHGLNPMDEHRAARLASNRTLPVAKLTPGQLAAALLQQWQTPAPPIRYRNAARAAARRLRGWLRREA